MWRKTGSKFSLPYYILLMPWPGFEPGLLRPQRKVLTTIRSRLNWGHVELETSLHFNTCISRLKYANFTPHLWQYHEAVVAEWLRRLTRNQIPSGSVGSNPTDCARFFGIFFMSSSKAFPFSWTESLSSCGRVVKASDSKSDSLWERRFESYQLRCVFFWIKHINKIW